MSLSRFLQSVVLFAKTHSHFYIHTCALLLFGQCCSRFHRPRPKGFSLLASAFIFCRTCHYFRRARLLLDCSEVCWVHRLDAHRIFLVAKGGPAKVTHRQAVDHNCGHTVVCREIDQRPFFLSPPGWRLPSAACALQRAW